MTKELAALTSKLENGEKLQTIEQGFPLVLNHLASAKRALHQHEFGVAILLAYATLERYVDLCLWVFHQLDDERPDFSNLGLDYKSYHDVGRKLHGRNYQKRELAGSITLSLGVQLLAVLRPDWLPAKFLGRIKGLMSLRNKCEFEHGLCRKALTPADVKRCLEPVEEILKIGLAKQGKTLQDELERYSYPAI